MGAIQDSLNSMITTAALGATGVKHLAEQSQANMIKSAELKSSIADAENEIGELNASKEFMLAENPAIGSQMEEHELNVEAAAGGDELAKAKEAMTSLSNKIAAKTAQKAALERTMANIGKTPMQIMLERGASKIKSAAGRLFGGKR